MRKYDPVDIFKFLCAYKAAHDGNSPTIREIQDGTGIVSSSNASEILRGLCDRGLIRITDAKCRNIEIVGGFWVPPADPSIEPDDNVVSGPHGAVRDLRDENRIGEFWVAKELFFLADQAKISWVFSHFFIIQAKATDDHKIRYVAYSAIFEPSPADQACPPLYEIVIRADSGRILANKLERAGDGEL